jgi:PST family polysaccharide transporter
MAGMGLGTAWSAAGGEAAAGAGRTLRVLATTVVSFVLGLVLLVSMVGPLGVVGVGASISLASLIGGLVMLILVRPVVGVAGLAMTAAIVPSVVAALFAAAATGALDRVVLHADRHGLIAGLALLTLETLFFVVVHVGTAATVDAGIRQAIVHSTAAARRRLVRRG